MPERVSVVDAQDEIIGEKYRDDLLESDCWRVSVVWLVNDKKEVLLAQRSINKKLNPGIWAVSAAGTVEAGEDYLATAYRELGEELGVHDIALRSVKKLHYQDLTFGWRNTQIFAGKTNKLEEDFVIQKDEVEKVRWVAIDEAMAILTQSAGNNSKAEKYWSRLFVTDVLHEVSSGGRRS